MSWRRQRRGPLTESYLWAGPRPQAENPGAPRDFLAPGCRTRGRAMPIRSHRPPPRFGGATLKVKIKWGRYKIDGTVFRQGEIAEVDDERGRRLLADGLAIPPDAPLEKPAPEPPENPGLTRENSQLVMKASRRGQPPRRIAKMRPTKERRLGEF